MRLKQLKLSGFKSFVDPTKIVMTHALSAVVGPNGCGKSNIIDAVRWVLGESSAKNLRGEGMTDVIFNGSTTRKPVSQANVELIFDNSDNRAQGPWQSYGEIAIKRQVNRDGQSDYFINGQKCRRRDVTDLLSGTGLGPRSYAIIEQGTISRLVESKPQELRVFIEEAAGITKYKERRRETQNRIKHSRENLDRLTDIKFGLDSQVSKLETQAHEAELYTQLKQQERCLNENIVVNRWQKFSQELAANQQKLVESQQQHCLLQTSLDDSNSDHHRNESEINKLNSDINHQLKLTYQHQAKISQLSSQLQSLNEQRNHQIEQLDKLSFKQSNHLNRQKQQQHQVAQLSLLVDDISPQLPKLIKQLSELAQLNQITERDIEAAELGLNKHLNQQHTIRQQTELAQHSIERIEKDKLKMLSQRELLLDKLATNQHQLQQLLPQQKELKFQQLQVTHHQALEKQVQQQQKNDHLVQELANHQQQMQQHQIAVATKEHELVSCLRWIDNLTPTNDAVVKEHYHCDEQLWKNVTIVKEWQLAAQMVLGEFLNAYCVDDLNQLATHFNHALVSKASDLVLPTPSLNYPLLSQHVHSHYGVNAMLTGVYCAVNIEQAQKIVGQLSAGESVITADGCWFGPRFAVIKNNSTDNSGQGILEIQQQMVSIESAIKQLQLKSDQLFDLDHQLELQVEQQQAALVICLDNVNAINQQVVDAKQQWLLEQQSWQHINNQLQDISKQIDQLKAVEQIELEQLKDFSAQTRQLSIENKQINEIIQKHQTQLKESKQQLNSSRYKDQKWQQQKHDAELILQKEQMKLSAAIEQQQVIDGLVIDDANQTSALQVAIEQSKEPLTIEQALLSKEEHALLRAQQQHKQLISSLDHEKTIKKQSTELLLQYQTKKQGIDQAVNDLRLKCETLKVKLSAQCQALEISNADMTTLARDLTSVDNAKQWPQDLQAVKDKLANIGAINLTAINEYNEQKERRNYLAQQINDLENALITLEAAIKKIDRESREKFKNTFDAVNRDFKILFPKVFGGGSAQLTLTDSDLLSSGVSIMAQPPGKKNSTIHLLSGGEKALTALSLVFAIFKLNPAPFCMLDEVDAPLDDANVERYCNLVREMSATVQFIFITHNKVSMEMAQHLTGVTMIEPGVSRVVAVDVAEAISMVQE